MLSPVPSCLPKTTGKVPGAHHSRDGGPYTCTASDCPQAPTTSQGVPPISRPGPLITSLPASVTHLCMSASIPTLNREPQASPSSSVPTPCPSKTRPGSQRGPSLPRHLRLVPPSPPPRCGRQTHPVTLPAGIQGYRTGSCSFLMPLAAALLWGTSPLFLLCPSLAGPASLRAGLSSHRHERPCVITSFTPRFPSGGASPHVVWAGSLPSLRGESGQTFGNGCPPPSLDTMALSPLLPALGFCSEMSASAATWQPGGDQREDRKLTPGDGE